MRPSCQTIARCTGRPVRRSHSTAVSRWLVTPVSSGAAGADPRLVQRHDDCLEHALPDLLGHVLDPAGPREMLRELGVAAAEHVEGAIDDQAGRPARALIDREDHERLKYPRGPGSARRPPGWYARARRQRARGRDLRIPARLWTGVVEHGLGGRVLSAAAQDARAVVQLVKRDLMRGQDRRSSRRPPRVRFILPERADRRESTASRQRDGAVSPVAEEDVRCPSRHRVGADCIKKRLILPGPQRSRPYQKHPKTGRFRALRTRCASPPLSYGAGSGSGRC